jgi:hypothetical protein
MERVAQRNQVWIITFVFFINTGDNVVRLTFSLWRAQHNPGWEGFSMSEVRERVAANDRLNAELVAESATRADTTIVIQEDLSKL